MATVEQPRQNQTEDAGLRARGAFKILLKGCLSEQSGAKA